MNRPAGRLLLAAGVVLVAVNLRPALASVGPVLPELRAALRLSDPAAALLTTLPVLCFGLLAPVAPRLGRRLGLERAVGLAVLAITAGLLVRLAGRLPLLYAGTVLVGAAIAVANVLLPPLIKRDFPHRTGLMMGLYTMALSGAPALAAATTVPLGRAVDAGWRGALGVWAVPGVAALLLWLPQLRRRTPAGPAPAGLASLLTDRLAWQVTAFMGLQSLGYYSVLLWLPAIFRDHGFSGATAGLLLSVTTLIGAPIALVLPGLASRAAHQRGYTAAATLCTAAGLAGLLAAPAAVPFGWAVLLGLGQGMAFPLALTLIVLRSADPADAARLSAMAQAAGYTIAALGPLAVGVLHDGTRSWTAPLLLLLALLGPQLWAGLGAGRPLLVDRARRRPPLPVDGAPRHDRGGEGHRLQ